MTTHGTPPEGVRVEVSADGTLNRSCRHCFWELVPSFPHTLSHLYIYTHTHTHLHTHSDTLCTENTHTHTRAHTHKTQQTDTVRSNRDNGLCGASVPLSLSLFGFVVARGFSPLHPPPLPSFFFPNRGPLHSPRNCPDRERNNNKTTKKKKQTRNTAVSLGILLQS